MFKKKKKSQVANKQQAVVVEKKIAPTFTETFMLLSSQEIAPFQQMNFRNAVLHLVKKKTIKKLTIN